DQAQDDRVGHDQDDVRQGAGDRGASGRGEGREQGEEQRRGAGEGAEEAQGQERLKPGKEVLAKAQRRKEADKKVLVFPLRLCAFARTNSSPSAHTETIMAEMTIRLIPDPDTGKKNIIISLKSDEDAMPHEHEQSHRALVDKLLEKGLV